MVQKWIRRGVFFLAIIIFLVAGFLLFLHTATGKAMVRDKVQGYLQQKWKTEVVIGSIDYRLPNWIALERVIILDHKKDTLLSGGWVYVGVKPLQLLSNTVNLTGVSLKDISLNCYREPGDSAFNFQFILDAFAPPASKKSTKPKGNPMLLSVRQLSLNNVRLRFNDQQQHLRFYAFINELFCLPDSLYPNKKTFSIKDFALRNAQVTIVDSSIKSALPQRSAKSKSDPAMLLLAMNNLLLENVYFSYRQPIDKASYTFKIDRLHLQDASLDLKNQRVNAGSIQLNQTSASLMAWNPVRSTPQKVKQPSTATVRNQWVVHVDTISLNNNAFVYHNAAVPAVKGLDFQHIHLKNITLQMGKIVYDSLGFFSEVAALSALFNNQLDIKRVSGGVHFSDSLFQVHDLIAAINQSQVTANGDLVWPLKSGVQSAGSPQFLIENLSLSYGDLLLLQPALKKQLPLSLLPSEKIVVAGHFSGNLQNIKANKIRVITSGKQLQLTGVMELHMEKGGTEMSAIFHPLLLRKQLLSKGLLQQLQKERIRLPEEIALSGKVQFTTERLFADLNMKSSYGQLGVKGSATNIRSPQQLAYNVQLEPQQLETGKWIGLDSVLGRLSGHIVIKGKGIQKNTLVATAQLQSVVINHYPYSNVDLQAVLDRSVFTIRSGIDDPHLKTSIDLNGHIQPDLLVEGSVVVKRADLAGLGLVADSLVYAGSMRLNALYQQPHVIHAYLQADSNQVFIRGKQIIMDSLLLSCQADADSVVLSVHAPFLEAQLRGNYPINALSPELITIAKLLSPLNNPVLEKRSIQDSSQHRTALAIRLTQDSLVSALLPQFELKKPLTLSAVYHAGQKDSLLFLQLQAPDVKYNQYEGRGLQVMIKTVDSVLQFSLAGKELINGKNQLTDPKIGGQMQRGMVVMKAQVNDSAGKEYYAIHVQAKKENDGMAIKILDDITLNHNQWKIPADNEIRIVKEGYFINHLLMENRGQVISIHTKDQQVLSPIDIRIEGFDISNISALLPGTDTLGAKGIVNANISLQQPIRNVPVVTGDIQATGLAVFNMPIGDLGFHSRSIGDSLALQGGLSGVNQLDFNGHLHLVNGGIDLKARLEKLNTKVVQALATDILSKLSGNITGDLQLKGSLDSPQYGGTIYLDSVAFALKELNTLYQIDKQKLVFEYPDLRFGQFVLTDSAGHLLTVQGKASLFSPKEKKLDVTMETKDFVILNTSRQPGASLYGRGIIDAKIALNGTIDEPIVKGNAYLQSKSSVHFVSTPRSNVVKTRKDGILFVKIDTLDILESDKERILSDSTISHASVFKGLKYNLDLKVDKDAEFSIIIDPSTGDEMVLRGDARLNAGLGEDGNIGIEGVYNLQSGYYKMNNLLLRGKFMLVKGSSISFNGDPALAEADVTTEYIIEASPKGLLNYKEDDAAYSQRVPFAVIFMIKGPLSKPALSFDIQLKEGKGVLKSSVKSDVEHALDRLRSDVTEMNKQVFSLLLTKQFSSIAGNNTLESSNLNANNALKEGVSSFLSEAMNQVADQLIKGVDVDVNMKTYKTEDDPISKTDLGVAMSKDLFQNRMVIRIEESFAVGHTPAPAKSGSQYIPDITSTYKLSKDGRFQIKAYQKNEYDAVVQGYFTEVGINFTIEMAYDKFQELIRRRKNMSNGKK